ncbi:MAG TPA: hypothetical protein VFY99_08180 [Solirubrobacterales bacterium]
MEAEELRERAIESLVRQRRSEVLVAAYVVAALALIAIWGLTGAGYFWPGWPLAAGALAGVAVALARAWSDRSFAETTVNARVARLSGQAPPGIKR